VQRHPCHLFSVLDSLPEPTFSEQNSRRVDENRTCGETAWITNDAAVVTKPIAVVNLNPSTATSCGVQLAAIASVPQEVT